MIEFMSLLLSKLTATTSSKHHFVHILHLYGDDLPSALSFCSEFDLWQHKWLAEPQLASELNTPEKALANCDNDFPQSFYTVNDNVYTSSHQLSVSSHLARLSE